MTVYVSVEEVLAIHEDQVARYGGRPGVRDRGGLESAIARPQSGYYADLTEEAAALWESLAQNHPFIDGNKRTAFAVTYTFLAMNGIKITAGPDTVYDFILRLYDEQAFQFDRVLPWLREWTQPA